MISKKYEKKSVLILSIYLTISSLDANLNILRGIDMTDKRIKKGNGIIAASNFVSIFMTVLLIILGLVLVILGATHKTAYITSSGSIAYKSEPSAGMIIGGIASWISIVFVWTIIKLIMKI